MINCVYGTSDDSVGMMLAGAFVRNTGLPICGPYTAMGFVKDSKLKGQAIFCNYTGANMDIHIYMPGCITRSVTKHIYQYVFGFSNCLRLTAKPYSNNKKLLSLLPRLGFVYECTQVDYYRDDSNVIHNAEVYKLTKDNIPKWANYEANNA